MAVRRGASSSGGTRCTGSIRDTSGLPDYDEIISNWTEYAMGASPRYLGQVGLSCDFQPRCFPVVLSVEAMADLQPPSSAVEQLSKECLCKGTISFNDFAELVKLLLTCRLTNKRLRDSDDQRSDRLSFQTGAWVFGGSAGVMTNMHQYPWLSMLLAAVVSMHCPGHRFSSVVLSHNVKTNVHKDLNNHPKVPSLVIPVSEFQQGEVWIGDTRGSIQRAGIQGSLHPVEWPYLLFNSRLPHATEDWIGDRTVLLVYHIRDGWRMSATDADLLSRRGFLFWTGDAESDPYLLTDEVMQEGPREAMLPL